MKKLDVLGVPIMKLTMQEAMDNVKYFLENNIKSTIYTPNSEIIMMARDNPKLLDIIKNGSVVVPDGIGLIIASKIKKDPFVERVAGVDLMNSILKYCDENNKSIFIIGGKPGVSEKAIDNISEKYPNIKAVGSYHGYFKGYHTGYEDHNEERIAIETINYLKPDVLFVAFGAPKQELWIDRYKDELDVNVFMGVGGSVDVYAGIAKRAPKIYQKLGLEWFYRLVKEPWRYKRMMVLPKFVMEVLKDK